ncbi:uncharacterized protein LOC112178047 isoform X3 [Rosa chinensis]|uniref:uncharacterized protein LOC112178047 isoform X3 n=1 Tax=Rosa chinensis TaxID=74649 RepID=UPI000D08A992|nr:uncharacterized protein LOC112178047 isoform X3 [Rosa chinensis]
MGVNFNSSWRGSLDVRLYTKGESIASIMHSSPKISGSRRSEAFVLHTFWSLAELHVVWLLKLVQVKTGSLTAKAISLLGFGGGSCWKHSKRTSRLVLGCGGRIEGVWGREQ